MFSQAGPFDAYLFSLKIESPGRGSGAGGTPCFQKLLYPARKHSSSKCVMGTSHFRSQGYTSGAVFQQYDPVVTKAEPQSRAIHFLSPRLCNSDQTPRGLPARARPGSLQAGDPDNADPLIPACAAREGAPGSGPCLFSEWPQASRFGPLQGVDRLSTELKNT